LLRRSRGEKKGITRQEQGGKDSSFWCVEIWWCNCWEGTYSLSPKSLGTTGKREDIYERLKEKRKRRLKMRKNNVGFIIVSLLGNLNERGKG